MKSDYMCHLWYLKVVKCIYNKNFTIIYNLSVSVFFSFIYKGGQYYNIIITTLQYYVINMFYL